MGWLTPPQRNKNYRIQLYPPQVPLEAFTGVSASKYLFEHILNSKPKIENLKGPINNYQFYQLLESLEVQVSVLVERERNLESVKYCDFSSQYEYINPDQVREQEQKERDLVALNTR